MVLYTPLAESDIFPEEHHGHHLGQFKGKDVLVEEYEGKVRLLQLISTDPQDFLNTAFSPGAIVPKDVIQDR